MPFLQFSKKVRFYSVSIREGKCCPRPVGLSYQGMPRESRVSLGSEAACSLLGMIKMMKLAAWIRAARTYWAPGPAKPLPETSHSIEDRCVVPEPCSSPWSYFLLEVLGEVKQCQSFRAGIQMKTQTHVGLSQPWQPPHPDQCTDIKGYQSVNQSCSYLRVRTVDFRLPFYPPDLHSR